MSSRNRLSARMRCFRPRSMWSHSRAATIRHQVEREDALGAGAVAVDVERDPHVQEGALGRLLAAQQLTLWQRLHELDQGPGRSPWLSVLVEHLVETVTGAVVCESHGRQRAIFARIWLTETARG